MPPLKRLFAFAVSVGALVNATPASAALGDTGTLTEWREAVVGVPWWSTCAVPAWSDSGPLGVVDDRLEAMLADLEDGWDGIEAILDTLTPGAAPVPDASEVGSEGCPTAALGVSIDGPARAVDRMLRRLPPQSRIR